MSQKKLEINEELFLNWSDAKRHPWAFLRHFAYTRDQLDSSVKFKRFPSKLYLRIVAELFYRERLIAIAKSRQVMMSWTFSALGLWDAMYGTYDGTADIGYNRATYLQSKKEENANELIDRQKLIYGRLHAMGLHRSPFNMPLMDGGTGGKPWGTYCNATFSKTGSILKGFPQGDDIARSVTASTYVLDETAFQPEAEKAFKGIRPTLGNVGKLIFISTPNGNVGEFFHDTVFDIDHQTGEDGPEPLINSVDCRPKILGKIEPGSLEEQELIDMDQVEFSKIPMEELCAAVDGIDYRLNENNGFHVLFLHYSADPNKNVKTEAGRRWLKTARKGYTRSAWRQENEIDFDTFSGRTVIENWREDWFVRDIEYDPGLRVDISCDFGTEVAVALFGQKRDVDGFSQIVVLDEIMLRRKGSFRPDTMILGREMVSRMETMFEPAWERGFHKCYPDPHDATKTRSEATTTNKQILESLGFSCRLQRMKIPESTDFVKLCFSMHKSFEDDIPGVIIHPRCKYLISVLAGGWHYPEQSRDGKPEVDDYFIHGGDATRYLFVNMIRPKELVGGDNFKTSERRPRIITDERTGRIVGRTAPKRRAGRSERPLEPEFMR